MRQPAQYWVQSVALVEDDMYLFNYHIMCFIRLRNMLLQNLNFYFFYPHDNSSFIPLISIGDKGVSNSSSDKRRV